MITIWKTPIVATVEQVLKDLKLQLYGAGLLKEIKNTGSDLMCTCPFHANGKEHNPSCGVLLQQKVTKDKTYEAGTVHKIRLYDIDTEDTKKTTHYAEVYSPTKIETFKCVDDGSCGATGKGKARQFASYEFVKEEPHIFGRIPIITVYNNEEQMSDLEKIETLVNDYDKVLSDVSNEAKMEKVLASIYASCQKEILASVTETIAKVKKAGGDWSYANQSALTRSRGLFEQIGEQIKALGQKEQITFRQGLSNIYTDQFLRQVYDLGQSITVKANFNRLNPALIQKTLDYPWSGAMFSDRLWQDKERLGRNLRVGLTQSMILGEGIPQITDRINKGIDTARYNAERVARTETKRVTYCAHDDVYKDTGVEELRYRCANGGDSRTCQYCRADNGKVFKRGEEPTLPRHPNCRCVYIPVVSDTFEDNELNELTGSVRGAENYEKWRKVEAKKQEEVKTVEKVSTKTVEKELKENPTPVPEQIKLTDYPQAFYATKPEAKNTQALLDYMNSKTSTDPNVVALYTKMDKLCDGLSDEVVLKVTHGEHRVKRSWNKNFDYVVDVGIPKINPNYIGTYDTNLHEEMHFLDMLITVKDDKDKLPSKMFSQSYKPLVEAFDKATPVIGDKAKKLFEDFTKECDIIYKKQQETFNTQHEDLKEQYRSGKIDWKKYNSLYKKLSKEVNEEADNERRALFGGGVSGLQDIYDAVSKGTFRDTGQVTYGHGSAYYTDRRRTNPNCSESLANYASLCVGHPELIDILAEDYPEIVTALRGCVEAMLKEVPK